MRWRCYYRRLGSHTHMRLFCGKVEGALGKCGDLVMRNEEFIEFHDRVVDELPLEFIDEATSSAAAGS